MKIKEVFVSLIILGVMFVVFIALGLTVYVKT